MRLRVRVFGTTLLSLTFDRDDIVTEECYEDGSGITGGGSRNFERSVEWPAEAEERGFEFR